MQPRGVFWTSTARDLGVALGAVAVDLVLFTQLSDADDQTGWVSRSVPPLVIVLVGAVAVVPLTLRRRFPYQVCLIMAGTAATVTLLVGSRPLVSVLVALYGAAVCSPPRRARLALLAVLGAHAVAVAYESSFAGASGFSTAAVAAVYLLADLGTWGAGRWGASAQARRSARRLERERTALARAAVDAERLRISRELHDIVAHAVTVMLIQAGGARAVVRGLDDPAASLPALEALDAVDATGREAVAELRRLLSVLRAEGAVEAQHRSDELAGLGDLESLMDRVRSAGSAIFVRTAGQPRRLDPSVDLTAYRIVQEALTNVNKYAGSGSRAEVIMDWTADRLMITVVDDGPHRPLGSLGSGGFGLVGLAERLALVGGRLEHGPRTDGPGYRIAAWLPVSADARRTDPIDELVGV